MSVKQLSLKVFMIVCFIAAKGYSQQNIVASGGEDSGTGGTVSYSIGQIDYITESGTSGQTTQGVQQPFEILHYTGIEENGITVMATAFPNPTSADLKITITKNVIENYTFSLCNMQGQSIINNPINGLETIVPMADLASGSYILRVLSNNKEVSIYKIIKN